MIRSIIGALVGSELDRRGRNGGITGAAVIVAVQGAAVTGAVKMLAAVTGAVELLPVELLLVELLP